MMTQCFPLELVDHATFSNSITKHRYIFIVEKGIPCGYALFDPSVRPARLIHLCIDDRFRNAGFGGLLLQKLIDTLTELGSSKMILNVDSTNIRAIQFYENFGFVITDSLYQYHCDLSKSRSKNKDITLELVVEEDKDELANKYNLGSHVISYFIQSRASLFYKILGKGGDVVGCLVYDKNNHIISPLMLDDAEMILQIIPSFTEITNSENDITINSTGGAIKNYIEESKTITVDYHLNVMTLDIN